ncbi:pyridoxine/pyridoxamine 5'-phosphate oxidase 2 isoform X2 [Carica papaya]|uniref:pyridoxine/pyridoxamine 5'-phosphate oxidase 2 isoform X2 n=1 Tax=Carica papaya TaxID=3649 RepID=UPI000B8CD757|nr:pyridoxine/pyridoxamine 5'-phosphate oxidase 2 isoform X2 [Carica papaya]XP_021893061.1 pyridoxine/pyridoxamine 5'-phosphate oxidase 2 isoform X2 [Carica papaya]
MATAKAPWKQLLLDAIESNSSFKHSSYFQLATIGSNGRPSNRTVVFRGFEESSEKIKINTDARTRKIEELKKCPFAEICWYFTDSWEQFRISGRIDVIDGSNPDSMKLQQREKSWFASSMKSRLQYLGASPGLPNISEQQTQELFLDPSTGPVASFCLLVLDPDQVDYLNLKSEQRLAFTSTLNVSGEKFWTSEKINL